MGMGTAVIPR